MAKKSQIKSKQLAIRSFTEEHLTSEAIYNILSFKKIGVARILNGIEVPFGSNEVDITNLIYDNTFFQNLTTTGGINGILTSGQGERDLIPSGHLKAKGECLWSGEDYDSDLYTAGNQGQISSDASDGTDADFLINLVKFPVYKGSVVVTAIDISDNTMTVTDSYSGEDDSDGDLIGDIGPASEGERINYVNYQTGELYVRFSSPVKSGERVTIEYKYTSDENYKVLLRDFSTRQEIVNLGVVPNDMASLGGLFAELYAEEYYPHSDLNEPVTISVDVGSDYVLGEDNSAEWEGVSTSGYDFETVGSILCEWNGSNDLSDKSIGLVTGMTDQLGDKKITLEKESESSYNGDCKFVRYKLRFYYYNTSWQPITFYFTETTKIDALIVESYNLAYQDLNNVYNYLSFYRLGAVNTNYIPAKIEEQMLDNSGQYNVVSYDEVGVGVSYPYNVPYIEFQINNLEYETSSLEAYVDGVRIFHYKDGDDTSDRRIVETDAGTGKFIMTNILYTDFDKGPLETGTQQVFVVYARPGVSGTD